MIALAVQTQHKALPALPGENSQGIRRIYDNDQLIERFGRWLLVCGKSANTRVSYCFAARQFARFLVNKPLTAATKEDVLDFIGSLYTRGQAATTIQARLDALRVLFDALQLGGQVRISVPRYILRRKLPIRLRKVKSEEEIQKIIAAATNSRDSAILELGYASGLRVAELSMVRVEDVNLRARSLTVRHGKGGNDRIALFGRPAADALRQYIGERTEGWLFLRRPRCQRGGVTFQPSYHTWFGQWREIDAKGKRVMRTVRLGDYDIPTRERAREALDTFLAGKLPPVESQASSERLTTRSIYRVVIAAAKRAGVSGVGPHTLRHSMATHCLNHGMGIRFVQELLGHTSLVATQKYLHVATANLKSIHTKFCPRG
jgi:integrase/recombinase XerC